MWGFLGIYALSQEDYYFKMLNQPVHGVSIYACCVTAMPLYWSDNAQKIQLMASSTSCRAKTRQIIILILRIGQGIVIYTHVLLRLNDRTITRGLQIGPNA